MNTVCLIGNVASDIEMRYTQGGKAIANFRLAVKRPTSGDDTDFFSVKVWDKQAEIAEKYLAKGKKVGLEGRLQYDEWEKDGQRKSKVEIVANRIDLIDPNRGAATENTEPEPEGDDDITW